MRLFSNQCAARCVGIVCTLLTAGVAHAQGVLAPGLGPVNRSMGSAAVAAPIDAIGALAWNPASIGGFEKSELACSFEFLIADMEVSSSIVGLGGGTTDGEPGAALLPNIAWVNKTTDPRLTIGFGVTSVAGFQTNYPADPTNPILSPQRTAATFPLGGFGRVASDAMFVDFAPTVAYEINDQWTVGAAPVFTTARLNVEPMVFAGVNDADGDSVATYPLGQGNRYSWGGGANFGVYYTHDCRTRFGASVKTPRWMEDFRFRTEDEIGNPLVARFDWDLPLVVSVGGSFGDLNSGLLAVDVRYIDYDSANGFGNSGVSTSGELAGLGWQSVVAVAIGMQKRVTDTTTLRAGYIYNENPIPSSEAMFNIAAPLFYQHTVSCGLTYEPQPYLAISMSYAFTPESTIEGPITLPPNPPTSTPATPVAGSSVGSTLNAHAIDFGVTVRY